jgi:hypothetical protein
MKSSLSGEDKKAVGFYTLSNSETDETYAGSGILGKRESFHFRMLQAGKEGRMNTKGKPIVHPNYRLQKAFNRNQNFDFNGVVVGPDDPDNQNRFVALQIEQSIIDEHFGKKKFLNLASDVLACFSGRKHSEETNEKNRQATTERWEDPEYRARTIAAQNEGRANLTPEEIALYTENRSIAIKKSYENPDRKRLIGQERGEAFKEHDSKVITDKWKDPVYRAKQMAERASRIQPNRLKVSLDGIVYNTMTEAADAVGVSRATIGNRISAGTHPAWFYVE